jgi:hypothetical protein
VREIFTLLNQRAGPRSAGVAAAASPVAGHPQVGEALTLLGERFTDIAQDGPAAYAAFLSTPGDQGENSRLRREAVATIRAFMAGFHESNPVRGHEKVPVCGRVVVSAGGRLKVPIPRSSCRPGG